MDGTPSLVLAITPFVRNEFSGDTNEQRSINSKHSGFTQFTPSLVLAITPFVRNEFSGDTNEQRSINSKHSGFTQLVIPTDRSLVPPVDVYF